MVRLHTTAAKLGGLVIASGALGYISYRAHRRRRAEEREELLRCIGPMVDLFEQAHQLGEKAGYDRARREYLRLRKGA